MALSDEPLIGPVAVTGADQPHVVTAAVLAALARGEAHPQAAGVLAWWQRLLLALARLLRLNRHDSLTSLWLPRGRQVCVIGGDGAGLAAAQLLCGCGRKVSVVTAGDDFGVDMNAAERSAMLEGLRQCSAVLINHSRVQRIDARTLVLDCDGADIDIPADLVVLSQEAE